MNNLRIAVEIRAVKDPRGIESLQATVPMRLIFKKDFDAKWLNAELKKFEDEYFRLVDSLSNIVKAIKLKESQNKVLLYWQFGNELYKYAEDNKNNPLFLNSVIKHLTRDLVVSKKFISRCRKFRALYPDVSKVNPERSFDSYVATFEGGYISASRKLKRKIE